METDQALFIPQGGGATPFPVVDRLETFGQFVVGQLDQSGNGLEVSKKSAENKLLSDVEGFIITRTQKGGQAGIAVLSPNTNHREHARLLTSELVFFLSTLN